MSARDPSYEREWIGRAIGEGGDPTAIGPFVAAVRHRLDAGEAPHGTSFLERPLTELFAELAEEPPDVAGWAVLIAQRLEADGIAAPEVELIQLHLQSAAAAGQIAFGAVAAAAELYAQITTANAA